MGDKQSKNPMPDRESKPEEGNSQATTFEEQIIASEGRLHNLLQDDEEDNEKTMAEYIADITGAVIEKNKEALPLLREIVEHLKKHRLAVNISQTVGAAVTIAGTVMVFTPIFPVGLGLLIGGGVLSGGAAIGDGAVTIIKAKEAEKIFEKGKPEREKLEECIGILKEAERLYKEETGQSDEESWAAVFSALFEIQVKAGASLGGASVSLVKATVMNSLTLARFAKDLTDTAFEVPTFIAGRVATRVVSKVAVRALYVVGAVVEVAFMVAGWVRDNPTSKQVTEAITKLEEAIDALEKLRELFLNE